VSGLVLNVLVCLVVAGSPVEALGQSRDNGAGKQSARQQDNRIDMMPVPQKSDATGRDVFALVEPGKDSLVIELGRSRLLRFPEGIRRAALSSAEASSVVQVGPKEMLVSGRKPGVANLTVWPADHQAAPSVIVVRVERRIRRDE